jgi:hypothetical protein
VITKGSRYRNLPESDFITARGERIHSQTFRRIDPLAGSFRHIVNDADRLDLLGYKYYGDSTRWWQIADANLDFAYPGELVGDQTRVEETFLLEAKGFASRFESLRNTLLTLGQLNTGETDAFDGTKGARTPHFLQTTVILTYSTSAATRLAALTAIAAQQFELLETFTWTQNTATVESFSFTDPVSISNWRRMINKLQSSPGVLEIQSFELETCLLLVYNQKMLDRISLLNILADFELLPGSSVKSRLGSQIIIPPNQNA